MNLFERCSDPGNAWRFRDRYKNAVKYLIEERRWIQFDNGWNDVGPLPYNLTEPVVKDIYVEAVNATNDEFDRLESWARQSQRIGSQTAILNYNKASGFMGVSIKQFDTNPKLLNTGNWIVDLETKQRFEHTEEELHLKRTNVKYNPKADCTRFKQFINEIFNHDEKLIEYVRRLLGYSLTGLIREQYLILCHGGGSNGKDMLLETVAYILGDYSFVASFDMFLSREKSDARYLEAVGELRGKRFVIAAEPNRQTRFDEALIKKLTGGNKLKGSVLHTKASNFDPTHKIWLATNYLPTNNDPSNAMWRRIRVIPFNQTFDPEKNTNLKEIFRDKEAEGILAWLIDAAHEYLTKGIPEIPEICKQANQEYREYNDHVAVFIREKLIKNINSWLYKSAVYALYISWCEDNRVDAMSKKEFEYNLKNRGKDFEKTGRQRQGNTYEGWSCVQSV